MYVWDDKECVLWCLYIKTYFAVPYFLFSQLAIQKLTILSTLIVLISVWKSCNKFTRRLGYILIEFDDSCLRHIDEDCGVIMVVFLMQTGRSVWWVKRRGGWGGCITCGVGWCDASELVPATPTSLHAFSHCHDQLLPLHHTHCRVQTISTSPHYPPDSCISLYTHYIHNIFHTTIDDASENYWWVKWDDRKEEN